MRWLLLLLVIFITSVLVSNVVGFKNFGRIKREVEDSKNKLWITKSGAINDDLLNVQALIVKDEEISAADCRPRKDDQNATDIRYSNKRYLMCSGSILTNRYILTSASCIHEAVYIRHNVKAPLAAMIAPFSDNAQVIKISEYYIHPSHAADPEDDNHNLYNVAIAKLACRIKKMNIKMIKLPDQPIDEKCEDESCIVAVIKKTSQSGYNMFEARAKDVEVIREKRDLSKIIDHSETTKETGNKVALYKDENGKVLKVDKNESVVQDSNKSKKTNNETMQNISKMIMKRSTDINKNNNDHNFLKDLVTKSEKRFKKLSIRSVDGTSGCPQTGSPVMYKKVQSALISTSCDDRQPETPWVYTDLYDNVDWINEIIGKGAKKPRPNRRDGTKGCSTCVYNYFINYDFKGNTTCIKKLFSADQLSSLNIPDLDSLDCNDTSSHIDINENKTKSVDAQNQAYWRAVNDLYSSNIEPQENGIAKNQKLENNSTQTENNENSNQSESVKNINIENEGNNTKKLKPEHQLEDSNHNTGKKNLKNNHKTEDENANRANLKKEDNKDESNYKSKKENEKGKEKNRGDKEQDQDEEDKDKNQDEEIYEEYSSEEEDDEEYDELYKEIYEENSSEEEDYKDNNGKKSKNNSPKSKNQVNNNKISRTKSNNANKNNKMPKQKLQNKSNNTDQKFKKYLEKLIEDESQKDKSKQGQVNKNHKKKKQKSQNQDGIERKLNNRKQSRFYNDYDDENDTVEKRESSDESNDYDRLIAAGIPARYAPLYKIFLEEMHQAKKN